MKYLMQRSRAERLNPVPLSSKGQAGRKGEGQTVGISSGSLTTSKIIKPDNTVIVWG